MCVFVSAVAVFSLEKHASSGAKASTILARLFPLDTLALLIVVYSYNIHARVSGKMRSREVARLLHP